MGGFLAISSFFSPFLFPRVRVSGLLMRLSFALYTIYMNKMLLQKETKKANLTFKTRIGLNLIINKDAFFFFFFSEE